MASKMVKSETQIETEVKQKLHNDLYTYLVCQRCKIVPKTGAIYVCAKGEHATCASCFISTKVCEVCKTAILTPSKGLEQLRTSLPMSCQYRKNGCTTVLTLDSLVYHEVDCEWRLIICPVLSCTTRTIIFRLLSKHLTDNHKLDVRNGSTFEMPISVLESNLTMNPAFWGPTQFFLKNAQFYHERVFKQGRFYFWIYYHGSMEEAKSYKCTLKVIGNEDDEYIYNGTVRSLDESKETVFADERALVISASQVRRLVSNTKLLKCYVKVSCPKQEAIEEAKKESVDSDLSD
jgi:hypothetical protein